MEEKTYMIVDQNWRDYLQIKDFVEFVATPSSWKFVVQNVKNVQENWLEDSLFEKPFAIISDLNYFDELDHSQYKPWDMIEKKHIAKANDEYLDRFFHEFLKPFVLGK